MKKLLTPKEAFNPQKLCGELKKEGIDNRIWDKEDGYLLEWEGATEEQVRAVIATHDPTPDPEPLTDLQQTQLAVAEAVEKQEADKIEQQLAQAEMFETILQMLEPQGGGE